MLRRLVFLCLAALLLVACAGGQGKAPDAAPAADASPQAEATRVLFIGNSYTFANDLPEIFAELARSGGHQVEVAMAAPGGWALARHAASEETRKKLAEGRWRYVVLQEQSVLPSQAGEREAQMYPAVRLLNDEIEALGAETILFMTWGRRDGLAGEEFPDFAAMQTELAAGYTEIAGELGLMVAPAGIAWQKAIEQNPHLELWSGDGSHPGPQGSYLAASVFYAVIFQQSPEGLAYEAGLPQETARLLQAIAAETVLADLERWHIK